MDARTILARLRDGNDLTAAELDWFTAGLATGAVSDAQAASDRHSTITHVTPRARLMVPSPS